MGDGLHQIFEALIPPGTDALIWPMEGQELIQWMDQHGSNAEAVEAWAKHVFETIPSTGLYDPDLLHGLAVAKGYPSAWAHAYERMSTEHWSRDQRDALEKEVSLYRDKVITTAQGKGRRMVTRVISDVEEEDVMWLWYPYLARGMLAFLDGDPETGKSLFTIALASALSKGSALPDQQGRPTRPTEPSSTVFLAAEDSIAKTMKRRIRLAGGDDSRMVVLEGWLGEEDERHEFTLQDIDILHQALETYHPALVVIDPIYSYLPAKANMNTTNEVKPFMNALTAAAEQYDAAILCVRHFTKGSGETKAMMRGVGSIAFTGSARTIMVVDNHPIDRTKSLLCQIKNNIGPIGRTQIFSKREGIFEWAGITRATGEMIAGSGRGPNPYAFVEALFWLEKELDGGIPRPSKDIIDMASDEGIVRNTLLRAKKALDVVSLRRGESWDWQLKSMEIIEDSWVTRDSRDTRDSRVSSPIESNITIDTLYTKDTMYTRDTMDSSLLSNNYKGKEEEYGKDEVTQETQDTQVSGVDPEGSGKDEVTQETQDTQVSGVVIRPEQSDTANVSQRQDKKSELDVLEDMGWPE